jgi:hypothetical protein
MPTVVFTLTPQQLKVRFREPYISKALNQKFRSIIQTGVYEGFTPAPGALPLTLELQPGPYGHAAVVESVLDASTVVSAHILGTLTVGLSPHAGQRVVLALVASYAFPTDTTATITAYQVGVDVIPSSACILAEVVVPLSGVIPSANIRLTGRSLAWDRTRDAIPFVNVVKNGRMKVRSSLDPSVLPENWAVGNPGAGTFSSSSDADAAGFNGVIEASSTSGGPQSANAFQRLNAVVSSNNRIRLRCAYKPVALPVSGNPALNVVVNDPATGSTVVVLPVQLDSVATGSWTVHEAMYVIPGLSPAGGQISAVAVSFNGATYAGPGVAFQVSDVVVEVEQSTTSTQPEVAESGLTRRTELRLSNSPHGEAVGARFTFSDASENVEIRRIPGTSSALEPGLSVHGGIISLGRTGQTHGVTATGVSTGNGVRGFGTGVVDGDVPTYFPIPSSYEGAGVLAIGRTGNSSGVAAHGNGTGAGLYAEAGATGSGVVAIGGSTSGAGVRALGGAGGGPGVYGRGVFPDSSGHGVVGEATDATSWVGEAGGPFGVVGRGGDNGGYGYGVIGVGDGAVGGSGVVGVAFEFIPVPARGEAGVVGIGADGVVGLGYGVVGRGLYAEGAGAGDGGYVVGGPAGGWGLQVYDGGPSGNGGVYAYSDSAAGVAGTSGGGFGVAGYGGGTFGPFGAGVFGSGADNSPGVYALGGSLGEGILAGGGESLVSGVRGGAGLVVVGGDTVVAAPTTPNRGADGVNSTGGSHYLEGGYGVLGTGGTGGTTGGVGVVGIGGTGANAQGVAGFGVTGLFGTGRPSDTNATAATLIPKGGGAAVAISYATTPTIGQANIFYVVPKPMRSVLSGVRFQVFGSVTAAFDANVNYGSNSIALSFPTAINGFLVANANGLPYNARLTQLDIVYSNSGPAFVTADLYLRKWTTPLAAAPTFVDVIGAPLALPTATPGVKSASVDLTVFPTTPRTLNSDLEMFSVAVDLDGPGSPATFSLHHVVLTYNLTDFLYMP